MERRKKGNQGRKKGNQGRKQGNQGRKKGNQGRKKGKGKKKGKEEKNEEGKKVYHTGVRTRDLHLYRHHLSPQGRIARTIIISIADFHFDDLIVAALAHARSLRQ